MHSKYVRDFLKHICNDEATQGKNITFVLDNARMHKAILVKLLAVEGKVNFLFMPCR